MGYSELVNTVNVILIMLTHFITEYSVLSKYTNCANRLRLCSTHRIDAALNKIKLMSIALIKIPRNVWQIPMYPTVYCCLDALYAHRQPEHSRLL